MLPVNAVSRIVDLLYPRICRSCGTEHAGSRFFCDGCLSGAKALEGAFCRLCAEPFPDGSGDRHICMSCMKKPPVFECVRAPYMYDGVIRDAIRLYKYLGYRSLSGYLAGAFKDRLRGWFRDIDVVAAVPLHSRRLKERGFNQSLLLARSAADELSAVLSVDGLVRIRNTRPQVDLAPAEREQNVKGAFSVAGPEEFHGKGVLLVDDVYTTGATVRECARMLKKAGAGNVFVLTVARAVQGRGAGRDT